MHTEDEARKLWCPHVRLGDEQGASASINRTWSRGCPDAASCMASKCMSWRWVTELKVFEADPDLSANVRTEYGFCGLAGRPD